MRAPGVFGKGRKGDENGICNAQTIRLHTYLGERGVLERNGESGKQGDRETRTREDERTRGKQ